MPSTKSCVLSVVAVAALASSSLQSADAFSPATFVSKPTTSLTLTTRFAEEKPAEAVFLPPDAAEEAESEPTETIGLETVEKLGKGAAKVNFEFEFFLDYYFLVQLFEKELFPNIFNIVIYPALSSSSSS
jgi:hypothetical protein